MPLPYKLHAVSNTITPAFLIPLFLVVSFVAAPTFAEGNLKIDKTDTRIEVDFGTTPVLRYRYAEVPFKPYVEKLFSPEGVNILRDSPKDHKHHHGLMFAVSVDGVSFWEEHQAPGRERHTDFKDLATKKVGGLEKASFAEDVEWVNPPDGKVLMVENRRIGVYEGDDLSATLLTWECLLALPPGKATATLTGHPYYGLGMRFVESMDKGGEFVNADGKTGVKGTNAIRSAWCAYTAKADGHVVTVAMFDHPKNYRHPGTWFTMDHPFAYLSDTMYLHREPVILKANSPMTIRYGVGLWDGKVKTEKIESLYQQWLSLTPGQ